MDTVTVRIDYPNFKITHPEYFSPRANFNKNEDIKNDVKTKDVYKKFTQGQSKEDRAESIYKPPIAIFQKMKLESRELRWFLDIQISVPRVIYPNNMYEISPEDSNAIISKLKSILSTMGVETTKNAIEYGIVTKFHAGKNIILPDEYTVSQAIALISKTVASRQVKKRMSHYENDGEAFHFYTSSHDRIFYDKLKDYERTKNTAIDKFRLKEEQILGKRLSKKSIQIFRFEVRYNGQQTVSSKLKEYVKNDNNIVYFKDLFNREMWKDVLIEEWLDIVGNSASQLTLKFETLSDQVFSEFLKYADNKESNVYLLNTINDLYGTYLAIRDLGGVQNYKNLLRKKFSDKTLGSRLETKLNKISEITRDIPSQPIISYLEKEIQAYERLDPQWISLNLI